MKKKLLLALIPVLVFMSAHFYNVNLSGSDNDEDRLVSLYSVEDLTKKYSNKKECFTKELAILKGTKKLSSKESNALSHKAGRLCKGFDNIPAQTASLRNTTTSGKGECYRDDGCVEEEVQKPIVKPIAISTPEKGKIFISIKNTGGKITTNDPIRYTLQTWGENIYEGKITKDQTNNAVNNALGYGEYKGATKNIFDANGVTFLLFTSENTGLEIRKSSNPVRFCIYANKLDTTGDCSIYTWTEYTPTNDIKLDGLTLSNSGDLNIQATVSPYGSEVYSYLQNRPIEFSLLINGKSKYVNKNINFISSNVGMTIANLTDYEFAIGKNTIKVCIDDDDRAKETNEANNCLEIVHTE